MMHVRRPKFVKLWVLTAGYARSQLGPANQREEREGPPKVPSDLPPRQSDTRAMAAPDSGYGSFLPRGLKHSSLQNQDPWNQPFAENAGEVQTDDSDIQLAGLRFNQYSSELASCLLHDLKGTLQMETFHGSVQSLPVLLKAFALRLSQSGGTRSTRLVEAVYFLYHFPESICKIVEERYYRDSEAGSPTETPTNNDGIPLSEKCANWLQQADTSPDRYSDFMTAPESVGSAVSDDENELSVEDLAEYHKRVCSSPAYHWLLDCIHRNVSLGLRGAATVSCLADQIIDVFPAPSSISRSHPIFPLSMQYKVSWNPIEFLRQQGHQYKSIDILSKIITLTGQVVDAQATTAEQYLHQTWPATGHHFLRAITAALQAKESPDIASQGKVVTYVYPDQTQISIDFCDEGLEMDVIGCSYSIAEVGEQLGWLMSALRSSSSTTSMSSSSPILRDIIEAPVNETGPRRVSRRYICTLDCVIEPLQSADQQRVGQCWHKLFINPVVVAGYPILPRSCLEPSTGLEAPFQILIALAETPVLTSFENSTLMKGYSTMLIPVLEICNIIVWHFVFDEKNDRISFLDSRLSEVESIDPITVENHDTRHIVGWCTKARSMTGCSGANYEIGHSGLRRPKVHHTLKNLSLAATRAPIGGALNFEISKKDKLLVRGFPKGYFSLITFLRGQHVVLYDVATRCAWLVDGQSAVLHLVRASLEKDLKYHGQDSENFLYRGDQLYNASEVVDGPEAAYAVLMNEKNRLLKLSVQDVTYHEEWTEDPTSTPSSPPKKEKKYKRTYDFFQDRVVEICTSLEKIIDHMNNKNAEDGISFVLRAPRENLLGGFDFMDIASNKGSFPVREMPLALFGMEEGWTTLTSSLGAITLFGKDFGELIHPYMLKGMSACSGCGFGAAIPHGKDYLVARSRLVQSVLRDKGDATTDPWQLVDGLYWQTPDVTFQSCACTPADDTKKQDVNLKKRIQVLYRAKFPSLWNRGNFLKRLEPDGAMIFGHSFLPNIRPVQRGKEETRQMHGAGSSKDVSRSSVLTEASDRADNTQSTDPTSLISSAAPTSDGSTPIDDRGHVNSEEKGKGLNRLAPNPSTVPDRISKKRTHEAFSRDDGVDATGSSTKRRIRDYFYPARNQNSSQPS